MTSEKPAAPDTEGPYKVEVRDDPGLARMWAIVGPDKNEVTREEGPRTAGYYAKRLNSSYSAGYRAGQQEQAAKDEARRAEQDAVLDWLGGDYTGNSSLTIAFWLAFGKKHSRSSPPWDASDFGRCQRLLKEVPSLRARLSELRNLGPVWSRLYDYWTAIEGADHAGKSALISKIVNEPESVRLHRVLTQEIQDSKP